MLPSQRVYYVVAQHCPRYITLRAVARQNTARKILLRISRRIGEAADKKFRHARQVYGNVMPGFYKSGERTSRTRTITPRRRCKSVVWLRPIALSGKFEFVEWTEDGHLRRSRFVVLRDDKNPKDVRKEAP